MPDWYKSVFKYAGGVLTINAAGLTINAFDTSILGQRTLTLTGPDVKVQATGQSPGTVKLTGWQVRGAGPGGLVNRMASG